MRGANLNAEATTDQWLRLNRFVQDGRSGGVHKIGADLAVDIKHLPALLFRIFFIDKTDGRAGLGLLFKPLTIDANTVRKGPDDVPVGGVIFDAVGRIAN
jgi:hypothetical protein